MKKVHLVILILLTMLTLLSLTLNGVIIFSLLQARQIALDIQQTALTTLADTRAAVTGISAETFVYTLGVEQEVPIATSVLLNEEVAVPINTIIPINTTVAIPIDAGLLGIFEVDVPIRAFIPVNLEVAVPISQTVDIATTVPLNIDVPIEIPIADTPLVGHLEKLDATLARLEEKLTNPLDGEEE